MCIFYPSDLDTVSSPRAVQARIICLFYALVRLYIDVVNVKWFPVLLNRGTDRTILHPPLSCTYTSRFHQIDYLHKFKLEHSKI